VAVILLVTNVLLIRWVRRPIRKLVEGVASIGQGRFDFRIEPLRSAEMMRLGSERPPEPLLTSRLSWRAC